MTHTNIKNDFEDLLPVTPLLTKAQAVRLLDRLYLDYIRANGLTDNAPDFRTLIDENVRATHPPSAIKTGTMRGNRAKYGLITHYRSPHGKNSRIFFDEENLIDWFNIHYVPLILKAA